MAVAAGLTPPRVMIIGLPYGTIRSNAAAIGWSVKEATIVVTRPLLDTLSRDELQAVVGRLIASIGNGDLRLAFLILSAFETIGLVRLAIHGAYRSDARRTLGRFVRLGLQRSRPDRGGGPDDPEAQAVQALLARGAGSRPPSEAGRFLRAAGRVATFLLTPLRIPLRWVAFTIRSVVTLSAVLFAGPVLGALWRRREMLADATAVQLTRNPDALAGALVNLTRAGAAVPGADALAHLFVVWPTDRRVPTSLEASPDSLAPAHRMIVPLEVRIAALEAMGARVTASTDQDRALARHAALAHSAATAALFTVALPGAALAVALILAIDLVLMSLTLGAVGGLMGALTHLILPASLH
jgi:Zn-dependent protease with chaperone function